MSSAVITAFPPSLTPIVSRLVPILDPPADIAPKFFESVVGAGESFTIPGRIYSPVPDSPRLSLLSDTEQSIVACWFTRHHDGYVREEFLRRLSAYDSAWVIAYVVALCGDYVIEILRCIWERRSLFDTPTLGNWLLDNRTFYERTRSRIVSYWNCYNRHFYPRFDDYVGTHILSFFDDCIAKANLRITPPTSPL